MPSCVFCNFYTWLTFFFSPFLLLQGCKDPASPPSPCRFVPPWTHCGLCPPGSLIHLEKPATPAFARNGVERDRMSCDGVPAAGASQDVVS